MSCQYNPEHTRHRCSPESRQSSGGPHKVVGRRWAGNPPNDLAGLLYLECPTNTTKQGLLARTHTETPGVFDHKHK